MASISYDLSSWDIELSSLNRLENIVGTLVQILNEERQHTTVTLVITLKPKYEDGNRNDGANCDVDGDANSLANSDATNDNAQAMPNALDKADKAPLGKTLYLISDIQVHTRGNDWHDGEAAADDADMIVRDIRTLENDMLLQLQRLNSKPWLYERVQTFVKYKKTYFDDKRRRGSSQASFEHSCNRLHILPRYHDDVNISNMDSTPELKVAMFLFFQWLCLLSNSSEECPVDFVHFEWLQKYGVVRVYAEEPALEPIIHRAKCAPSSKCNSTVDKHNDDKHNTVDKHNDDKHNTVDKHNDDKHNDDKPIIAGNDSESTTWNWSTFTSDDQISNFTFTDGNGVLCAASRPIHQLIAVCDRDDDRISGGRGCLTVLASQRSGTTIGQKRKATAMKTTARGGVKMAKLTTMMKMITRETKMPTAPSSPPPIGPHPSEPTVTEEQRRVIDTLNRVWVKNKHRRIVVDGVAGSGKTFLLGLMLKRFPRVLYLVKKRNFIDATSKRFSAFDNLRMQTIDSYLMNLMNIRNLQSWLHMRQSANHLLKQRLQRLLDQLDRTRAFSSPAQYLDGGGEEELVFVDEYSLIESSLAELLNVALFRRTVLLVGDCNQQPAIGEREDQAVRTMLGYENICFMYENVRTKDPMLLRRLACFTARSGCGDETNNNGGMFAALHGLPMRSTVDLRMFLRSICVHGVHSYDRIRADYNLLPRLIVASNERVNYANWAIGYLVWRNCPICHGSSNVELDATLTSKLDRRSMMCCLRYKRTVVVTFKQRRRQQQHAAEKNDANTAAQALRDIAQNAMPDAPPPPPSQNERNEELREDDAYADEHFVLLGMRYRMIHSHAGWPVQIGSRVIVREIEAYDTVIVETDDDKRVRCRLRMTYVKPYEYGSRWQPRFDADREYSFYMFPFVMDAATTVYQVQGLTLDQTTYPRCYVDVYGMNDKALYVTLSRFQTERQIISVINCHSLDS